jgi:hypothetical protein
MPVIVIGAVIMAVVYELGKRDGVNEGKSLGRKEAALRQAKRTHARHRTTKEASFWRKKKNA